MLSVKNDWCNFTYLGPRDGIGDLPCRRETDEAGDNLVISWWKPTAEELALLVAGGSVQLSIYNEPIPPVALGVVWTNDDDLLKWAEVGTNGAVEQ